MTTLTIKWLQKCRCGNKTHIVESSRGNPYRLWDDDSVKCNSCGREGIIQVTEGFARVLWETDEEQAERKSMTSTKDHNNHPAHSPLTSRRLHQMRDILSKAAAQRDGGDIGYAMSDAVKLIDEVLARRAAAFEATFPRKNPEPLDGRVPIQDMETSQMRESLDARYKTMLEAAPQPAPAVPDGLRLALSNAGIAAPESDEMLSAKSEKLIQELVTWVKERKPFQPAPVVPDEIDVNDPALDTHRKWMAEGWNRCCTAMLQAGNSPAIPDGWIPVSDRMPGVGEYVLCLDNGDKYQNFIPDHDDIYTAAYCDRLDSFTTEYWGDYDWMKKCNPTHWAPIPDMPAAPQQEVNRG